MIDIQIVNNKIMKVQEVKFNLKEIEKQISKMKYRGNGLVKDDKVENAKLPSIAKIFYENIFLKKIPSPEKLFKEYLSRHFIKETNNIYKLKNTNESYRKEGIKGRVYRAYPSLLRDFHFYILCYNSGLFENVEYSFLTDTQKGVDLFITYKGTKFAISLFVNTNRSLKYKKKKYKRHNYTDLKEICISINPFDKKNYIGDFALYQDYHIKYMIGEMEKEILKKSQKSFENAKYSLTARNYHTEDNFD